MTTHAISYGARTYAWPSIQKASQMLRDRIDAAADKQRRTRPCQ